MEKRAIVEPGRTPSELSGKKSTMIKNGMALAEGEEYEPSKEEDALAKHMRLLYNRSGAT